MGKTKRLSQSRSKRRLIHSPYFCVKYEEEESMDLPEWEEETVAESNPQNFVAKIRELLRKRGI